MIFGIGTDILEVGRMQELIRRGEAYLETIFTPSEREYCQGKVTSAGHYAARLAAKEAFLKALGSGRGDKLAFTEIEVERDELGKPGLSLHGKAKELCDHLEIKTAALSMSHVRDLAMAVVILEK